MDGSQFDTFARLASEARTRRMALLTALGGLAAAGLATASETEAKKRKKKKCKKCKARDADSPCSTNKQCCTNETNRACAVPENDSGGDKTCCGALGGKCGGVDENDDTVAPFCCADYECSSSTQTPGTCQPSPII